MERSEDYSKIVDGMVSERIDYEKKYDGQDVDANLRIFSNQLFKNIKKALLENNSLKEEKNLDAELTFSYKGYNVTVKNDELGNVALYFYPQSDTGDFEHLQKILFFDDARKKVCHMDTISIIPILKENVMGKVFSYDIKSNNKFLKDFAVNADVQNITCDEQYYAIADYITNKINEFVNVSPFSKEGYLINNFYNDSLFEK